MKVKAGLALGTCLLVIPAAAATSSTLVSSTHTPAKAVHAVSTASSTRVQAQVTTTPAPVVGYNHRCSPRDWTLLGPTDPSQVQTLNGGSRTLSLSGFVCASRNFNLVVLNYGTTSKRYYVTDGVPSVQSTGIWSYTDATIGAATDPNQSLYFVHVLGVSNRCLAAIQQTPTDSTYGASFTKLPRGCGGGDWSNQAVIPVRKGS